MDFWDQKKSLSTLEMKNMVFLSQKNDGNIFTDYWKVLVLTFSGMGNTVSFWAKKLMERWYLLITEKFLFWTFRWWEIRFFSVKKLIERWYLLVTEKFLYWTFRWCDTRSFFQPKNWWKDDIYLVFFSFPWYSRTWEIRFLVQW